MAGAWRYFVVLAGGVAIAAPVQLRFDGRTGIDLHIKPSLAFAESGEGNGNGGGSGNSGNGNADGKGGSSDGGHGNGNPGDGNGGGKGGDGGRGNRGGDGNSGNSDNGNGGGKGNSGGGRGAGNGGQDNTGKSAGGSGSLDGGASGSAGNGGSKGAGGRSAGDSIGGKAGTTPGKSSEVPGQIGKAAKGPQTVQGLKIQPDARGKKAQESIKSAKAGQDKTKEAKSNASRDRGKAASSVQARGATGQGNVSRTASAIKDRVEVLGSPFKPRQSQNSIVVAGLSDQDLIRLATSGLLATSQTRGVISSRIVRLNLPKGMSIAQARRLVQRINIQASAALDTFYYTDEGASACSTPGCDASTLVGWTRPAVDECAAPPKIGLIDTGIRLDHDALKGQSIEVLNASDTPEGNSSKDHGTAIAALLVGRAGSAAPGLMPQARLVAVDAFSKGNGAADRADVLSLVRAIEALADRGVKIINLSLSGPPNEVLKNAIDAAHAQGIVLVAAAGNNGAGAEPSYPAAYPGVIAVTAVDRELKVYRRATHGQYVTFAAPGVEIQTAQSNGGSSVKSGTSYAVPFVSAAMAMVRSAHPKADIEDLQKRLQDGTRDLGEPGRDATFGYGLVQMTNLCATPGDIPVPVAGRMTSATIQQESIDMP